MPGGRPRSASLLDVADLLLVTGSPLTTVSEKVPIPDLEIDSIGAVNLASRLNHGEDFGGNPIGRPTAFHIGIHLNPTAYDLERELARLNWKLDAGAEFAVTAPIFDVTALRQMLSSIDQKRLPIVATIWPLRSAQEAEFFEERLASVSVPEPLVERMRRAESRGDEEAEGLAISRELAAELLPLVQGIQVAAPSGRIDLALAVLEDVLS